MFRLAENDCLDAQAAASRRVPGGLDLYSRLRGLQPGAHAESDGCSSGGVSRGRSVSRAPRSWNSGVAKTPKIRLFDAVNNEQLKEDHAADQFFRSLLKIKSRWPRIRYIHRTRCTAWSGWRWHSRHTARNTLSPGPLSTPT